MADVVTEITEVADDEQKQTLNFSEQLQVKVIIARTGNN